MPCSRYKRFTDNKMRSSGSIDYDKKEIKVNRKKSKNEPGGVLDTMVHEEMHRLHPRRHEKNVKSMTTEQVRNMSKGKKKKIFSLYG